MAFTDCIFISDYLVLSGMDLPNIGEMGNLLKKLNGGAPDLKSLGKKPSKKDA